MTSSLAAGITAARIIRPKTAYTPWSPTSEVSELVTPATGTRRSLAAQLERSVQLYRSDVARGGHAEHVASRTAPPRDGRIALRKASARKRANDRASGRLDAKRHAGRAGELEGRSDAGAARTSREEAEGVVERELPVGRR